MFSDRYEELKDIVEEALYGCLPAVDGSSRLLEEAMEYSLYAGGKRIRPILLLAACEMAGGSIQDALPFACAIECIHTYSLIHDDHPSMDDDELRRGKPTNHVVYGDDMAILAGDGLLNSAFDIMLEKTADAMSSDPEYAYRLLRASCEISSAAGVRGMVAGQAADVRHDEVSGSDEEKLLYIHKNKTGALLRAAVRAGAVIGGAEGRLLEDMTVYAENLGLTFQIVDDMLDVTGDAVIMGKNAGVDAEADKLTYPAVYGLDVSREKAEDVNERAVNAISGYEKSEFLCGMAADLLNRVQ